MGQPLGSVLEARFSGTCNGQRTINTLHYRVATAFSSDPLLAEYSAIAFQINTGGTFDLCTPLRACCGSNWTLNYFDLQFIYPIRYVGLRTNVALAGTFGDPCDAQNVSSVIEKYTILAGRKYRGNIHLPGVSALAYINGVMTADYNNDANTLATAIKTQVAEDSGPGLLNPCIFHRGPNENPKYTDIANAVHLPYIRTMRSRTIGVGV